MGYSIYIHINKEQKALLETVLADEFLQKMAIRFDSVSNMRMPIFDLNEISYRRRSKSKNPRKVFGIDYGSFEAAHATMVCICKLLGKTKYMYDGEEWFPVKEMWWNRPDDIKGTWREKFAENLEYIEINKFTEQIERRFKKETLDDKL